MAAIPWGHNFSGSFPTTQVALAACKNRIVYLQLLDGPFLTAYPLTRKATWMWALRWRVWTWVEAMLMDLCDFLATHLAIGSWPYQVLIYVSTPSGLQAAVSTKVTGQVMPSSILFSTFVCHSAVRHQRFRQCSATARKRACEPSTGANSTTYDLLVTHNNVCCLYIVNSE
jgi:hypothetical protein